MKLFINRTLITMTSLLTLLVAVAALPTTAHASDIIHFDSSIVNVGFTGEEVLTEVIEVPIGAIEARIDFLITAFVVQEEALTGDIETSITTIIEVIEVLTAASVILTEALAEI